MIAGKFCQATCGRCSLESLAPESSERNSCGDVPPTSDYSCKQQKEWGKCDRPWMKEGNFCATTCGRCS